ncbi:prepilin-type N-terminal cleavage/methylation domain-containing protein [Oribacterium sp. P6A1]|uniref:prepilin-type N-terminal cleavage/methylation domain-containing protein n=1 Tax=Oribacterium sp. P6A1 TaxID=1410612 RepID=UPI00056301BB|nr:prepilin-type N-terminal cleavage/methylation domain-containing protein [Oribacterium sp. P6A1]
MKNKCIKGFTMAELLIVVAIVGVLVAVSIPLFTAQLEKTRETADIHTMRAAAALGQQFYYAGVIDKKSAEKAGMQWYTSGSDSSSKSNAFAIYIPDKGAFSDKDYNGSIDAGLKAYGKGTKLDGGVDLMRADNLRVYDPTLDYTNAVLQVSIFPNGDNKRVEVAWKKLQKGNARPFIGNGEKGKDGYKYSEDTYPRMVIKLS